VDSHLPYPPPPQLPDLERVEDPEAPQGEDQEGWQVDADLDDAAGNEGINDDTFVIRGNGNRVLNAKKLAAQAERARQLAETKRIKKREADKKAKVDAKQGLKDGGGASGWCRSCALTYSERSRLLSNVM
jgi:hypothetical protein